MARRLLRLGGATVVVALGFVTPVLAMSAPSPASADTIVDGCTIVSNPTATDFTDCPGDDLSGADLSSDNLSFADLAGIRFADCNFLAVTCDAANLDGADLTDANLASAVFYAFTSSPPSGSGSASGVANLDDADLSGADLSGATIESALLQGANLTGVNATGANISGAALIDANLTDANLTNATGIFTNLTGVTLTDAIITGTSLLPPTNQTWNATSNAGAVVTWQPFTDVPGAAPSACNPPSGSTLPIGTTTLTCQVFDANGNAATGTFQVTVDATHVVLPAYLSTDSGVISLDAVAFAPTGITKVVFELNGISITNQVIATGTPSVYGWLATWDTTSVPDGGYSITALATDADNVTYTSSQEPFAIQNGTPVSSMLMTSSGASVSGRASVLDASASRYVTTVTFMLLTQSYPGQPIASGTLTPYGWLATWNTTTVPNGTYSVYTDVAYANGQNGYSAPVSITVNNPLPTTTILIPSKTTTLGGSTYLDASASNATSVKFLLFGGGYGFDAPVICTATSTIYGWLCGWNTSAVPDGSYVVLAEASNSAGSAFSSGVSVTVDN
jgi:uncharacterized protein YjbI with pentapeptide repeats